MCGIVAFRGGMLASSVLIEGLKNLEYRGYDSWGMACCDGKLSVVKRVGRISQAEKVSLPGNIGIAHTRWATHGQVTEENSHPHLDCTKSIAVVHNGIIENYQELKSRLASHSFASQTDSEIITHLIEDYSKDMQFDDAVRKVAGELTGRSAFVALCGDKLVAARKGAPLITGISDSGFFIASDINAFLAHTNKVMYLDDYEMVVVGKKAHFFSIKSGKEIEKRVVEIGWKPESAEKSGYEHFLIKEIMEQKETIFRAINQDDEKILDFAKSIDEAKGTFLIGCGTAGKVAMAGEYLFSKVAKKHINSYPASEFPNYQHYLTPKSLVIAISQSGETADVLEAIESAKSRGSKVISLLNSEGSTMSRVSDEHFMVNAGFERAVVSTKATTSQLAVITLQFCSNFHSVFLLVLLTSL